MTTRTIRATALAAMLALVASVPLFARSGADAQSNTINIQVGYTTEGITVDLFLYDTITVAKGTTINWEFDSLEVHTVTFGVPAGNPTLPSHETPPAEYTGGYVSSGTLLGGADFAMQFPETGSYEYFCVYHPFMTGTINVVDGAGESQAVIDARAYAARESALFNLRTLAAELRAKPVAVTNKPDGGKKYTVTMGAVTEQGALNLNFPEKQTITVNDTIEWLSETPVPHTVTFGVLGPPQGDPTEVAPVVPAGNKWDGTGLVHSGVIGDGWDGGTKFELTFTKAGTYDYYCYLHVDQGQVGQITVKAAPVAPLPPNTGEGMTSASDRSGYNTIALAAVALLALGGAGLVTAFKRR